VSLIYFVAFLAAIARYNFLYRDNLKATYKENKTQKIDPTLNKHLYFGAQFAAPFFLLVSFLISSPILLKMYDRAPLLFPGLLICIFALVFLSQSKKALGENYSPCQDSYLPNTLTTSGVYRYVRHPLYSANILFFFGVTIASGLLWSYLVFALLIFFFNRSASLEEKVLSEKFPDYETYCNNTKRFIPFVF
jgi:protein-S-isoprenylcysteine O-methyltransferase Ste14